MLALSVCRPATLMKDHVLIWESCIFTDEEETVMTQSGSGDYYSFGENIGGINIYELWDYIKDKMENECEKLYSEFKVNVVFLAMSH